MQLDNGLGFEPAKLKEIVEISKKSTTESHIISSRLLQASTQYGLILNSQIYLCLAPLP